MTMKLENTHPNFQRRINALASASEKPAEEIYARWRVYSAKCDSFDQSPILGEFVQWNEDFLGGNKAALEAAIA